MQPTILVTGGTGLVGKHLLHLLVQQGHKVRAIYRNTTPDFLLEEIAWVRGDILDILSLEEAMQGIQQVYHCAAVVSFNPKAKHQLQHINIEGTANVVNACIETGVQKLLFVSSVAALGRIREDGPVNETMQWSEATSNSEYGRTKYLAEMEVWRGMGEGLEVVVVNPSIILGCSDWNQGSAGIFKSAYNEFPWYTEGVSGFVDVQDLVNAMYQLMHTKAAANQRFIVSGYNISYKEIFTSIATAFGKKPPYKKVTPFIAAIVWRVEAIKGWLTGKQPLLTKETAATAQAKVYFDHQKMLQQLPNFKYTTLQDTIARICNEFKQRYQLS
jgi:nucleoside-diphosphate-sugar epimerase